MAKLMFAFTEFYGGRALMMINLEMALQERQLSHQTFGAGERFVSTVLLLQLEIRTFFLQGMFSLLGSHDA